ncbi:MAG: M23 family metallopeptidase, partial [Gammaproteobacteria bacterium]
MLLLPLGGAAGGYFVFSLVSEDPFISGHVGRETAAGWRERLQTQKLAVKAARETAEERLKALTLRMAEIQARVLRLDALGERLARAGRISDGEFDFSRAPSVGGPEEGQAGGDGAAFARADFVTALDDLMARIDAREAELRVLEGLMAGGRLREENFLAGNPVRVGYLSSTFGQRIDPFHGALAFHKGVDYAGPPGSDIVATGAGIVMAAGRHPGYGLMVEINHGDGITTLYAHASKVLVRPGDIVQEGQAIAILGSTGRSTGPHVHYEVRR